MDYATHLSDHVTLTCRCVGRIFLPAYVTRLAAMRGAGPYLPALATRFKIPSSAGFGEIGE